MLAQKLLRPPSYIYFGQRIKLKRENQEAEMRRIKLNWAAFGKHLDILENKKLAQHQKTREFDMCDDVRFPNVDNDEEKYGQIDQDTKSNGAKNAACNIKG